MRKRTKARELALQFLYQVDVTKDNAAQALEDFWQEHRAEDKVKGFSSLLIEGTLKHQADIDRLIVKYALNWELKRMAVIDRNIIRLAAHELLYLEDIPPKVSINEAIELAKKYGDVDSGRFVNGILDKINKSETKKKQ